MAGKCPYFYQLCDLDLIGQAKAWLKKNPPPRNWQHSAWRWAADHMPRL